MTVFDKIRGTTSFGVVEVADSFFVDARAYSKVSLTEITSLKLPVINGYLLTGEEAGYEAAGNAHYNNPQIAFTRTAYISPSATVVSSGDSTLSLCGKSYGSVNLTYDADTKAFYQIIKSKGSLSTATSSLIRFSKNPAEPIYKGWEVSRSNAAGSTNGSLDLYRPDYGSIDVFLNGVTGGARLALYTSIAQNEKPASGTYANSGLNRFTLSSVGPSQYWIDAFTTTNTVQAKSVATDRRGNVYFVAHTVIGSNNSELVIVKTDSYGNLVWQKTLGGTTNEYGYAIHADKDDNVYVAGATSTGAGGTTEAFLGKLTVDGALAWQKTFGGAQSDVGYALTSDSSGNIFLAGTALASYAETDAVSGQMFVAKVTSAGAITWQKALSAATTQSARSVAVDSSGNVYVAGYVDKTKTGSQYAYILKLNSSGAYVWDKHIANSALSAFYDIVLDASDSLLLVGKSVGSQVMTLENGDILTTEAGDTLSTEAGSKTDLYLAKVTSAGVLSWQKTLSHGTMSCTGYSIGFDGSTGFYITAMLTDATSSIYLAKLDGTGSILWQNTLISNGTDRTGAMSVSPNGELLVASTKTGTNQVVLSKLSLAGTENGTYGSFSYQPIALTSSVPESTIADTPETGASTLVSSLLSTATPTLTLANASLTLSQTPVTVSLAGGAFQSVERSTGWLQATYLDASNQNQWAIFADSQLYSSTTTATPVFAVNRSTGTKVSLGDLHTAKAGALGCFVSNAEPLTTSNGNVTSVVFYGVKMAAAGLSVQCATVNISGATPSITNEACTLSSATNLVGFDSGLDSVNPPESRRVRPFLIKNDGTFFLGVIVYDVTGKARIPSPYNLYIFRITNKTSLALEQTLDISANGVPLAAMPMGDSQKRWLVAYSTKLSVFRWTADTGFAKVDETVCANLSWIGVDSRQRIWFTDTGTADEAGKTVSYYDSQISAPSAVKSSFILSFDDSQYTYTGQDIVTNLRIKYLLPTGAQAAQNVVINISSENAKFEDGTFTKTATTLASGEALIPIVIKGPGYVDLTVTSTT